MSDVAAVRVNAGQWQETVLNTETWSAQKKHSAQGVYIFDPAGSSLVKRTGLNCTHFGGSDCVSAGKSLPGWSQCIQFDSSSFPAVSMVKLTSTTGKDQRARHLQGKGTYPVI